MFFSIPSTALPTAGFYPSGKDSGENNPDHSVVQSTTQDPANVLPDDMMKLIFSHLDLSSLEAIRQVSKTWRILAGDDLLWKNVIYREIAFSNRDWKRCFGPEVLSHEDCREEWNSLPWREYIEDSRKFDKSFPEKSGKDHLMLVRLPKTLTATRLPDTKDEQGCCIEGELVGGLTLNSIGQLAKKYFPETEGGYRYIRDTLVNELGDHSVNKSCWVLITKKVLEGSRNQPYNKQQEMVADLAKQSLPGYEVPETLEAAACILSQYFMDSKRLYSDDPLTYTRCKEELQGYQTVVGGFAPAGLGVFNLDYDSDYIGVAALRKF